MPAETRAVHEVAKMLRAMPALETSTTVRTRLAGSWAVDGIIFEVGMDVYINVGKRSKIELSHIGGQIELSHILDRRNGIRGGRCCSPS